MERTEVRLTELSDYCGCGAKLSAEALDGLLECFLMDEEEDDQLLIGPKTSDDAAAYQMEDGNILLQSVDFFPPVVDDPYDYGQIAAANALSDIYAMGGKPITVMNLVCFPQHLDKKILTAIVQGGRDKVREAGAIVVGGHSIIDNVPKYGLSVTGTVEKEHLLANNTVEEGDCLILTKPIGTGIVLSAAKADSVSEKAIRHATAVMKSLNRKASEILRAYSGVHACSDITGFGLGGHLIEMLKPSGLTARICMENVPLLTDVWELAEQGFLSGGSRKNREHFESDCQLELSNTMQHILFDPQTSGGLLISVSAKDAKPLLQELQKKLDTEAELIGRVESPKGCSLIVSEEHREDDRQNDVIIDEDNCAMVFFANTYNAMWAQKILKDEMRFEITPVPEEVKAGCGIAICILPENLEKTLQLLEHAGMDPRMRGACKINRSHGENRIIRYQEEGVKVEENHTCNS